MPVLVSAIELIVDLSDNLAKTITRAGIEKANINAQALVENARIESRKEIGIASILTGGTLGVAAIICYAFRK